jgi:tetratricopeptide (TPR) repeat protein
MKTILALLGFLVVAALPAPAQSTLPPDLEQALSSPVTAAGLQEALAVANTHVTAHPQDGQGFAVRCVILQALAAMHQGDEAAAKGDCEKAVALAPQSAFAHYAYADLLYDTDHFPESLAQYSQAIALGETGRGIYWKRCDAYRRVGQLDAALRDCNAQIDLTPNSTVAYYARGRLRVQREDFTGAISDLNVALQDPQPWFFIDALYWRGMSYASLGNYSMADSDLSSAIDHGDKSADTFFERGQVRRNLREDTAALSDLRTAQRAYLAAGMNERAAAVQAMIDGQNTPAAPVQSVASSISFGEMTFTGPELLRLFAGLHAALDPKDKSVHVIIISKSPSEMPAYDREWHYDGVQVRSDGTPAITLWVTSGLSQAAVERAVEAGLFLGLADSGYCGEKWKKLYDATSAADAKLGTNAADPFANRRALALQLVAAYEAALKNLR